MTDSSIKRVLQDALNPSEAARVAGVTRATIHNWMNSGKLRRYETGAGETVIMRADLTKVTKYSRARES